MLRRYLCVFLLLDVGGMGVRAQTVATRSDSVYSLDACLRYAMKNQPAIRRSLLNQRIADYQVKEALADWLPQVNGNANLQHYVEQPVSFYPDFTDLTSGVRTKVTTGTKNSSTLNLTATQAIYNRDVMLASKTGRFYRRQAVQNLVSTKIDLVVDVSKAYYDVFTSEQQLQILSEDVRRLEQSVKDTKSQFDAGIVDKTDYKQATIQLNNAKVQFKQSLELIPAKYAYLKQLMGYPVERDLAVRSDSTQMAADAVMDTVMTMDYGRRIELQLLETQRQLQLANYQYQRLGWLPSVSFFYDYNGVYMNDKFSKLYNETYPNSYYGLTLSIPIFQGLKRMYATRRAYLSAQLVDIQMEDTRRQINTEYTQAMAEYRSNLNSWQTTQENIQLSREVYATVTLQYKEGIKTYLDVITAESDLKTSQINGLNALFALLSSKLDVMKALGIITTY